MLVLALFVTLTILCVTQYTVGAPSKSAIF